MNVKTRTMHGWTKKATKLDGWVSTWVAPDGSYITQSRDTTSGDRHDGWLAYRADGSRITHLYSTLAEITRDNPKGFNK